MLLWAIAANLAGKGPFPFAELQTVPPAAWWVYTSVSESTSTVPQDGSAVVNAILDPSELTPSKLASNTPSRLVVMPEVTPPTRL